MLAYDSNAVSPHACGVSLGWARSAPPSSRIRHTGAWHSGAARALRAWWAGRSGTQPMPP